MTNREMVQMIRELQERCKRLEGGMANVPARWAFPTAGGGLNAKYVQIASSIFTGATLPVSGTVVGASTTLDIYQGEALGYIKAGQKIYVVKPASRWMPMRDGFTTIKGPLDGTLSPGSSAPITVGTDTLTVWSKPSASTIDNGTTVLASLAQDEKWWVDDLGQGTSFIRVKLQANMHHDKSASTLAYAVDSSDTEDTGTNYFVYPGDYVGFWGENEIILVQAVSNEWRPIGNGHETVNGDLEGTLLDGASAPLGVSGTTLTVWLESDWTCTGASQVNNGANIDASVAQDGKWRIHIGEAPT